MNKPITFEGFDRLAMRFTRKFAYPGIIKDMLGTNNFGAGIVNRSAAAEQLQENLVSSAILLNSEYRMHPMKKHSGQYFDYGHMRFHVQYQFYTRRVKSEVDKPEPDLDCEYVEFKLLNRWKNKPGMNKIASMIINLGPVRTVELQSL